ncbi:uncharacterized protein LOC116349764 [Contarinia nasturtii]|uniref:uncharacterized protein LOC116349764 n=1 Tax=Contarinia nasturtii TaxID=265458 RepID=UPI0012D44FBD|nr:uncharacterized protein LOC116349764 [Contarinia nasturtii]
MAIRCGLCSNVMVSEHFFSHRKRKHPHELNVPFTAVSDDIIKSKQVENVKYVRCRFCPNDVPVKSLEKHLERCHIDCGVCGKTLLKSKLDQHMRKHNKKQNQMNTSSPIKADVENLASEMNAMAMLDNPSPIRPSPSSTPSSPLRTKTPSPNRKSNIVRCNEWQLHNYIRQGRVYTKNGCLYLRNI